jgi:NAD(P)-dependent dehydrogenase (short-subunit alcohol dehydrogenase family)
MKERRVLLHASCQNYWLYGTAKSAMIGMANNLKHEGRDLNIKVNCLMPGAATAMTNSNPFATQEEKEQAAVRMPPELVTCATVFLCHGKRRKQNHTISRSPPLTLSIRLKTY